MCTAGGGHCVTQLDGYYVEIVICLILGVIWYFLQRQRIIRLQSLDKSAWQVQPITAEQLVH